VKAPGTVVSPRLPLTLVAALAPVLLWSAIGPRDRATWWLEAAPALLAVPLLAVTFRRFPLTPLAYGLVWLHAVILLVGAHYTYAEVPLFNWLRDALHLGRNHYDRIGHLAQGFVPAILAREVLLRTSPLQPGRWLFFIVCCVVLAISATYELIEWWAALVTSPTTGTAFLGTQGDPWDTQWDMFLALIGAVVSQATLGRVHQTQLNRILAARRGADGGHPACG
jgi:putative membrane protein